MTRGCDSYSGLDRKDGGLCPFSWNRSARKGEPTMKKILIAAGAAVAYILGVGAGLASADPTVTVCHSVSITVNDTNVSDAGCNVLPPQ